MHILRADDFKQWREQARGLLAHGVTPLEVSWADAVQPALFGESLPLDAAGAPALHVPKAFMALAPVIACHRDVRRWDLLYQLLFRLTHGEKHLLKIAVDPLTHALRMMESAVRRDAHKMKAFVRFRLVQDAARDHYIAWHQPDHLIVALVAPFFMRRFETMEWTILTPDASVHWAGSALTFGPGVPASEAPDPDRLEDLWRDYYRATFNPARIKLKTMKREMPVRHWKTLPETQIIADMLAEAPARERAMLAHSEGMTTSAADYLPIERDIENLRRAAMGCEGCDLHRAATRTVFGVGPTDARLMIVGEQPGNDEDLTGAPFVGPAGAVLDEALEAAGLQRTDIYITNAVKHFRFVYKDSFRQHQSPSRYHTQACKPWLDAEIARIRPVHIACLGNVAARSLIQPNYVMKQHLGTVHGTAPTLLATYHPSAILRARGPDRSALMQQLTDDLRRAGELSKSA